MLPNGFRSVAKDVSADGSVVVGYSNTTGNGQVGSIWKSATNRMQDLNQVLAGVPGAANWLVTDAIAVSGDGNVIAAIALNRNTGTFEIGAYREWRRSAFAHTSGLAYTAGLAHTAGSAPTPRLPPHLAFLHHRSSDQPPTRASRLEQTSHSIGAMSPGRRATPSRLTIKIIFLRH